MTREEAKEIIGLLKHIKELQEVEKILSTFISPFFTKSIRRGWHHFLPGSFHLGGTKSGRMSSSKPNLQQIPSTGTKYAKAIKSCFTAPMGWLLVGADYSSLEDRISALQTKDPNKLKVYLPQKRFVLEIDGVSHRILGDTAVEYDGQVISGEQLYEILNGRVP